jgi:hypothetical protein
MKETIVKRYWLPGLGLLLLLGGCAGKRPAVDYDPGFATAALHTFTVTESKQSAISPITSQRIESALHKTLISKGYVKTDAHPDFTVTFGAHIMKDVPSNVSIGFGFGSSGPHSGIGVGASKQLRHDEAVLDIQMSDTKQNHTFWTVSYRPHIDTAAAPKEREAQIDATVAEMLESFPKAHP